MILSRCRVALIQFITKSLRVWFFLIVGGATVVDAANPADGPEIVTDYTAFGRRLSADEMITTLALIGLQTEEKFRQIHTCTGSYDLVHRSFFSADFSSIPRQFQNDLQDDASLGKLLTDADLPVGDEPPRGRWSVNTGSVEFFWNVDQDKVHSVYYHANWLGYVDAKSRAKKRVGIQPYSISWTITPDGVLEFDSSERRGPLSVPGVNDEHQQIGPIIYRRTYQDARRNAGLVDVRKFFSTGGSSPWERCHDIVQSLDADSPDESHKSALNHIFVFTTDSVTSCDHTGVEPKRNDAACFSV